MLGTKAFWMLGGGEVLIVGPSGAESVAIFPMHVQGYAAERLAHELEESAKRVREAAARCK